MDQLFILEGVTVGPRSAPLLSDISLTIRRGEVLSVIGSNGAGKSTLIKLLIGLIHPSMGIIQKMPMKIGYVPQFLRLDAQVPLTVREFLHVFSTRTSRKELETVLSRVGGSGLLSKSVHSLSGGETRRVLLAAALLQKPDIFLLDEPTAGMDMGGEKQFYQLIRELKQEGSTIVLVSHDMHHVAEVADRVVCLDTKILCEGSVADVQHCGMFDQAHLAHFHHHHE